MEPWPLLVVLLGSCCLVASRAEGILTTTLSTCVPHFLSEAEPSASRVSKFSNVPKASTDAHLIQSRSLLWKKNCRAVYLAVEVPMIPLLIRGGEMPFVQSFQDPKYKIEFHGLDSPFPTTDNQEKIPMTDRDGKKYVCSLSNPRVQHNGKTGDMHNGSSIGLVTDERSTRKSPEELLEELKDLCFRRDEGWWSYVLCFKGDVRQFHADTSTGNKKGQITQEFILGQYDEKATAQLHRNSEEVFLQKDPRSQTAAQRYHAHLHTNGTKCDLTNEPRETEVRYVCSDSGQPLIRSIKEAPSCKYTVVFHVPALCKHSLFQEEQPPWVLIHCNEVT